MAMTKDEVFVKVKEVLTTALAVDDDEVTPDAHLTTDLGAESIDFLDIIFQLEKSFGIKIPKNELMPDTNSPDLVQNGKLTPKGVAELKTRMPFLDLTGIEADPDVTKIKDAFTVDSLVNYVMTKLSA
ncbi:MAG TPA: acyl carrier protein [Phycisphaerae bacterium]|jgi:acyl carrier protein|nr:acyl carrier protein [Phycisphaerae bacterium]